MLCGFVAYVLSIASLDCLVRGLQLDQSAVEKPYPQIPCDAAEGTDCAPSTIPSNPLSLFQKPWNPRGWRKIETRIGLGFGPNLIHWQDSVLHRFGTMSCKDLALKSLPTEAAAAVGQCAWHLQKRQQPLHSGFVTNVPTFYVALDGDVARNWLANFSAFTSNLRIVDGILGTNRNDVERMVTQKYKFLMSPWLSARPGVLGCLLSHLRAIKSAYDLGLDYALILESDALPDLAPWWPQSLEEYISTLPEGWQASQLAWTTLPGQASEKYSGVRRAAQFVQVPSFGSVAYLIHRRGMDRIVSRLWDMKRGKFNLLPLLSSCTYPTSDDCLLSFTALVRPRRPLLDSRHIYQASPPMFTSFNRRSDVQSEEKKWVTQSFCDDISSALRHGSLACASNKSPL
eukprot:TRINITY_DN12355_c0_g1_i3.p1 TRINITY_DN12355_c0_g1~~TRINITY_DN12355_c0_g1_i3.p1  ORF type:complete len:411 (+),score=38.38 TRINITY_DN12355_c0_g1_i3:34-1233(+)